MTRPDLIRVGPVRVRAIRGPHKRDAKLWYWRAEHYRDRVTRTLWSGWATRDGAFDHVVGLIHEHGLEPPDDLPRHAQVLTVRELLETWWAEYSERPDLSPKSIRTREFALVRLAKALGDKTLKSMDNAAMERWRDGQLGRGRSSNTVKMDLVTFRQVWRWASERQILKGEAPTCRLKVKRLKERYIPDHDEMERVLKAMWESVERRGRSVWAAYLLHVLASTGMRIGEAAALRWADFDQRVPALNVNGKTGVREVVIPDELVPRLLEWKIRSGRIGGRLWPVKHATIIDTWGELYLSRACRLAGVPRFTPHSLRDYVEAQMIASGTPIDIVATHMGHSPLVALKHYLRPNTQARKEAVRKAGLG